MRKWDYFDMLIGVRNPKTFKKELKDKLHFFTLVYLQNYGRAKYRSVSDIAMWLRSAKGYDFKHESVWNYFASHSGMKGEITQCARYLRSKGYPVIAGTQRKGYRYADENCDDIVEVWEERRKLWEKERENTDKERQTDMKLLAMVIEKIKNRKKKEQLIAIQQKYRSKSRKKND